MRARRVLVAATAARHVLVMASIPQAAVRFAATLAPGRSPTSPKLPRLTVLSTRSALVQATRALRAQTAATAIRERVAAKTAIEENFTRRTATRANSAPPERTRRRESRHWRTATHATERANSQRKELDSAKLPRLERSRMMPELGSSIVR